MKRFSTDGEQHDAVHAASARAAGYFNGMRAQRAASATRSAVSRIARRKPCTRKTHRRYTQASAPAWQRGSSRWTTESPGMILAERDVLQHFRSVPLSRRSSSQPRSSSILHRPSRRRVGPSRAAYRRCRTATGTSSPIFASAFAIAAKRPPAAAPSSASAPWFEHGDAGRVSCATSSMVWETMTIVVPAPRAAR